MGVFSTAWCVCGGGFSPGDPQDGGLLLQGNLAADSELELRKALAETMGVVCARVFGISTRPAQQEDMPDQTQRLENYGSLTYVSFMVAAASKHGSEPSALRAIQLF